MTKTVSTTAHPKAGSAYVPAPTKRQIEVAKSKVVEPYIAMVVKDRRTAQAKTVRSVQVSISSKSEDLWHSVKATTIDLPAIDQHGLVQVGVPTEVLDKVLASFVHLDEAEVLGAVGVSSRTVQRRKSGVLSTEHSGAMLDLIAVTHKAMDVLGSREAAENWLHQPALAFDGRRPIELLSTRPGSEMVKEHLVRMDYGVYA